MQLSVQAFTLRNEFETSVEGTLSELAQIGYRFIETAGTYGLGAHALAIKLREQGMQASGMHVGLGELETGLESVLDDAAALGVKHVILPWISSADYAEGWDKFAQRLEPIADAVAEAGFAFSYHNHAFEFERQPDGRTGFDAFFQAASPKIGAEIDVWWAHVGGEDPAELLRRHAARSKVVHWKDGTSVDSDVHAAAGKGVLDWGSILKACQEIGVEFGVVELDNSPYSPLQAVRESCEFFRSMGIVG